MRARRRIAAKLATLPPEARHLALTHLAHLAAQRKTGSGQKDDCQTCRERVAALLRAVKEDDSLPPEACPVCDATWAVLEGTVPPGPPGFPILPARRPFFRLGMATMLDCPIRDLPGDEDLVRAFAIARLVQRKDPSESVMQKALDQALQGKAPHQPRPWEERMKLLDRRIQIEHRDPRVKRHSYLKWYRGDFIDTTNSEILLAEPEIEDLGGSRPDLLSYALARPTIDRLLELPE